MTGCYKSFSDENEGMLAKMHSYALLIEAYVGICVVTKRKNKNILISKICLFTMWDRRRYACSEYMLVSGMLVSRDLCTEYMIAVWDMLVCV